MKRFKCLLLICVMAFTMGCQKSGSATNEFPEMAALFSIDKYPEADALMSSHLSVVNDETRKNDTSKKFSNGCYTDYYGTDNSFLIDNQEILRATIAYFDSDNQIDYYYIQIKTTNEKAEEYKKFAFDLFGKDYQEVYDRNYEFVAAWEDGSALMVGGNVEGGKNVVIYKGFCGSAKLGTKTRYE